MYTHNFSFLAQIVLGGDTTTGERLGKKGKEKCAIKQFQNGVRFYLVVTKP